MAPPLGQVTARRLPGRQPFPERAGRFLQAPRGPLLLAVPGSGTDVGKFLAGDSETAPPGDEREPRGLAAQQPAGSGTRSIYTALCSVTGRLRPQGLHQQWTGLPRRAWVRISPKATYAGGRRGGHDHPQGLSDTWNEAFKCPPWTLVANSTWLECVHLLSERPLGHGKAWHAKILRSVGKETPQPVRTALFRTVFLVCVKWALP